MLRIRHTLELLPARYHTPYSRVTTSAVACYVYTIAPCQYQSAPPLAKTGASTLIPRRHY
eukprot:267168-Rhodomonas_salina.1